MAEKYFVLRTECSLKPILRTDRLELDQWNRKFSMKISNSKLVHIRSFNSCTNKHPVMTECKQPLLRKLPVAKSLCYSMPSSLSSFKLYPATKKYITLSLACQHESSNLRYQNMSSSPSSSSCPVHPKLINKLPFLKTYNKCPLLLKNLQSLSPSPFKYLKLDSLELRKDKKILTRRNSYLIPLHGIHRREFHITLFSLTDSNSDKSFTCKKMDEICKSTEAKKTNCGQSCDEKSDLCQQKKAKCDKRQQPKKNKAEAKPKSKIERKIVDPVCKKTCLAKSKCEWLDTALPPKMEYIKVTCPSPKFTKPNPCPSTPEHFQKNESSHMKTKKTNFQKKQFVCTPLPLPKPPFEPIALCPCPPPRKMHPGSCPCYEKKEIPKKPLMQPCPLKKKYPCPTDVHYCPFEKKPCKLKQSNDCENKKKKKMPAL